MSESITESSKLFQYGGVPAGSEHKGKVVVSLGRTDILRADVQVVREGGANNLHSHSGTAGFWYVLSGKARFYEGAPTGGSVVIGEFVEDEGVIVPRDVPYWFESASDEPLELLHVSARDPRVADRRTDHEPRRGKLAGESGESV
jgi:mannose-6-phosphate isomerase-like protein (cupin superfamily)